MAYPHNNHACQKFNELPAQGSLAAAVRAFILGDMLAALGGRPDLNMEIGSVRDALFSAGFGPQSVHALADRALQEEAARRVLMTSKDA
ncbi:hypothetical protein D1122_14835 [Cereibacter sphaeroides]|uniref:hypothetical protein n=1 Tax=Cereibacter sphaeroides TaxID=1063 RepID=UPI000E5B4F7B|nr:hypothetical protein [Cereibacter sphaeroides]RHZ95330.1 hypothetical protein D1122_14835 [Cereibacter sphaeroides]